MRVGIDAETGRLLKGWPHCQQSIRRCLRTRFRTREMRFHLGSEVPELQDENASPEAIFSVFVAIAEALADPDGGEPGFVLREIEFTTGDTRSGRFVFLLSGTYFPRGHLGDYSLSESRTVQLVEAA